MKNIEVSFEVPVDKLQQLSLFLKSIDIKSIIHLSCAPEKNKIWTKIIKKRLGQLEEQ